MSNLRNMSSYGTGDVLPEAPAMPPVPPPEKKNRKVWVIAGAIVAGFMALGLIGTLGKGTTTTPTPGAPPIDTATCLDAPAGLAATHAASTEFSALEDDLNANNFTAVAGHVDVIAADYDQVAEAMKADPAIAGAATSAATWLRASADAVRAGNFDEATSDTNMANTAIDEVTAAINSTTVPTC